MNIISICGDPGGTNALLPVLRSLSQEPSLKLTHYTYAQANTIFSNQNLSYLSLEGEGNVDKAISILKRERSALVLTATSHNNFNWEKKFIAAAKKLSIPSFSVLDFWSNYSLRFSDERGRLNCLPDMIAVMDKEAMEEMIRENIPASKILITGQPAFDRLADLRQTFSFLDKQKIRNIFGLQPKTKFIVFVSQPLRSFFGKEDYLGFDEHQVLEELIETLGILSLENEFFLLIRPHPREDESHYQCYRSDKLKISVSKREESHAILLASDLVIGMNSIALIEACYLGKKVISYQPNLNQKDTLPTNRSGLSHGIFKKADLLPKVISLLSAQEPPTDKEFSSAASEKIVKYLDWHFLKTGRFS